MKTHLSWFRRNKNNLVALCACIACGLGGDAFAAGGNGSGGGSGGGSGSGGGVYTMKISPGISRRQTLQVLPSGQVKARQNLGVGNEHASIDQLPNNVLVMTYMSSNVANQNGPSTVKCSSIQMSATGAPTVLADQVQLTTLDADRAGHTTIACDPTSGHCLLAYGANNVNGDPNTQTYATVVDQSCKDLSGGFRNHVQISNGGTNEGAPRAVWDGEKFVFGYYRNSDAAYGLLVGIKDAGNGQFLPQKLTVPQRLTPSNIGRPSIVVLGKTRALFAVPRGQQRPSEGGNEVRMLNTDMTALTQDGNGDTVMQQMWKQILVQAKPDSNNIGGVDGLPGPLGGNGIYPGQPQLALGDAGEVYLSSVISNGAGRNRNKKGSSTHQMLVFKPDDTGANVMTSDVGLGVESTHVSVCSGMGGTSDAPVQTAAIYGASLVGFGAASLSTVTHDPVANKLTAGLVAAVSAQQADSGYLNNMLGRNPAQQGREHLVCLGNVPNPGYGMTNGFMPKVKSFFVAPWGGRVAMDPTTAPQVLSAEGKMLPEDRNALFVSFVPAVRDKDLPPPAAPPASTTPSPDPGAPAAPPPGDPTQDPSAPTTDPGTASTPGTAGTPGGFTSGCDMAAGTAGGGFGVMLLLAAFASILVARRRWS